MDEALRHEAAVIGMSALLTATLPVMGSVVQLLRARGLQGRLKTLVGGAPVDEDFARQVGTDAYAYDGLSAVERLRELLRES